MNASNSIVAGRIAGVVATTALILGITLGTAAFAQHGGSRGAPAGRPQATPTYDAWVKDNRAPEATLRVEASSGTILTDAAVDTEIQATPERRVFRHSR